MVAKSLDKSEEAAAKNWRLSLNSAPLFEKIFSHFNRYGCNVKKVLKLIKDIKKVALEEKERDFLKSYNVRQTLLWCAHSQTEVHHTEDQLLLAILRQLSKFLEEGFLPSFLEEKRNLLFSLSEDQCKTGHHLLENIIKGLGQWMQRIHNCQNIEIQNVKSLAAKLKEIPGVKEFFKPHLLAGVLVDKISRRFVTADKDNEERCFFDHRPLPKSRYGPQFQNNIEGLKFHLEKALQALKSLLLEEQHPLLANKVREHSLKQLEGGQSFSASGNVPTVREEKEETEVTSVKIPLESLSTLIVEPGDASLSCLLPSKEIVTRGDLKVTATDIRVQGIVREPAPLALLGNGPLVPPSLCASLSMNLDVSLRLEVVIFVKLFGRRRRIPTSYAASLQGVGRVQLVVNLEAQEEQKSLAPLISAHHWDVVELDLGSSELPRLLERTATAANTYSSCLKDHLAKKLEEGGGEWSVDQLEEKIQVILNKEACVRKQV